MFEEIKKEISALVPDSKTLRNFAYTMFAVLLFIALLMGYKGNDHWTWPFLLAAIFILFGIVAPMQLKIIYQLWMGLAVIMGYFVSRIILSLLYYGTFLPIGLILKIFKKDLLGKEIDKSSASYWIKREQKVFNKSQHEKLF